MLLQKFQQLSLAFSLALIALILMLVWTNIAYADSPGDLDVTFGGTGIVTVPLEQGGEHAGYAIAVHPTNNKIVITGVGNNASKSYVVVARYNSDGTLDSSFNGTGVVTTSLGTDRIGGLDVAIQSNGKIVVAGLAADIGGNDSEFALLRYNNNGTLDTTFSSTGIVTTPLGGNDDAGFSVALQPDGKIVVAGMEGDVPLTNFAVVRYLGGERAYLPVILKN
jgi:uncharacterized delta-60 repeat protein